MPNYNEKTGIRFGVIHQNEVLQAWADDSEPNMPDCGCPDDCCECEPNGFYLDDGEYKAESDDVGDIFVIESPYYTLCRDCSPCAPGAGYIMNQDDTGEKTYCFGPDWFDDKETMPKIYKVADNSLVS